MNACASASLRCGLLAVAIGVATGAALAQQPQPARPRPAPAAAQPAAPAASTPPPAASAPQPAAPDPAFEASRAAFEALPEAERRAVQDALVWTGHYLGVTEGNFGARTRGALIAFEKSAGLNPDGIVDPKEIALLLAAGRKARDAAKFAVVRDDVSGLRIGVPAAVMTQKTVGKTGMRFAAADGQVSLETTAIPVAEIDLPALFDRMKVESPVRKVTYKLARPDWFVVSGESAGKRFYSRFARGVDAAGQPTLRGFTVNVPAARADLERIVIAIANSFEPFPGAAAPATQVAATGQPGGAAPVPPPRLMTDAPPPPRPIPSATALSLGGGRFVAVLQRGCVQPSIAGREAKIARADARSGLTLLETAGGPAVPPLPLAPGAAEPGAELVVVGYAAENDPGRPLDPPKAVLTVAAGAASGGQGGAVSLAVGLQPGGTGAPVFDRQGRLAGLIGAIPDAPRLVAGVSPLRAFPVVPAQDLAAFLSGAGFAPPAVPARGETRRSVGELAQAARPALAPVACLR